MWIDLGLAPPQSSLMPAQRRIWHSQQGVAKSLQIVRISFGVLQHLTPSEVVQEGVFEGVGEAPSRSAKQNDSFLRLPRHLRQYLESPGLLWTSPAPMRLPDIMTRCTALLRRKMVLCFQACLRLSSPQKALLLPLQLRH